MDSPIIWLPKKFIVNGASRGILSPAGIVVVPFDEVGSMIVVLSCPAGIRHPNEVEVLIIRESLNIFKMPYLDT